MIGLNWKIVYLWGRCKLEVDQVVIGWNILTGWVWAWRIFLSAKLYLKENSTIFFFKYFLMHSPLVTITAVELYIWSSLELNMICRTLTFLIVAIVLVLKRYSAWQSPIGLYEQYVPIIIFHSRHHCLE